MSVKTIQEQINGLWSEEALEIKQLREDCRDQANSLKAAWKTATGAYEAAEELRAQAGSLTDAHAEAGISGNEERATELQAEYRDLQDRASELEEQAADALSRLKQAGIDIGDREDLERTLEARLVSLQSVSPEEVRILEEVSEQAAELTGSIFSRAEPFIQALPTGASRTQATGYILQKTG